MKRRYRITTASKSFGLIFENESLIDAPAFYYDFIERLAAAGKDQTKALHEVSVLSGYKSKGAEITLCGTDNEIVDSVISTFGLEFESISEFNPEDEEYKNLYSTRVPKAAKQRDSTQKKDKKKKAKAKNSKPKKAFNLFSQ